MSPLSARPRDEYAERLTLRQATLAEAEAAHARIGTARLFLFLGAVLLGWKAPLWTLILPAVLFVGLILYHSRLNRRRTLAQRAVLFYSSALERLDDRWMGKGEAGERFRDPHHPYSDDLDLFGSGSLFELLSTARTRAGEAVLARWLTTPAPPAELMARQDAVRELGPLLDLREDLAVLGEGFRTGVNPEALAEWGAAPRIHFPPALERAAPFIAAFMAVLIGGYLLTMSVEVRVALLVCGALEGLVLLQWRVRVAEVAAAVEQPGHDLALLAAVLARFEEQTFRSPRLRELRGRLDTSGQPASRRIARLQILVDLLDSRDNVVIRTFGSLILWTTQIAFAVERWRAFSGPAVAQWLGAVGEMEALCSLAGYAYEHPGDPFPVIVAEGAEFAGVALCHPLLPAASSVPNDLRLSEENSLLVVSGSNMSGKSTFLRTAGINAVLALAGGPIRGQSLTLSCLRLGASIRVTDSLQGGTSRFYAEITRLRDIVGLAERGPTLFLLDELLNGTNSHDRGIGAEGVVHGLLRRHAIGIVTTHDLALTAIAGALGPRASNRHFEDHLEDGVITFDYRIREGVVSKSNALELMRAVGLEV